jgi:hypothetical protein
VAHGQGEPWTLGDNAPKKVLPAEFNGNSILLAPTAGPSPQIPHIASRFMLFQNQNARWFRNQETGFYALNVGSETISVWPLESEFHTYSFSAEGKLLIDGDSVVFSTLSTVKQVDPVYDATVGKADALQRTTYIWLPETTDQPAITLREHMLFSQKDSSIVGYFGKTIANQLPGADSEPGWVFIPDSQSSGINDSEEVAITASGQLISVQFPEPQAGSYAIFDLTGKSIAQGNVGLSPNWSLTFDNSSEGLYLVKIQTRSGKVTVKRIVLTDQ